MLVREQLEKEAIARTTANRAWDDDEVVEAGEEGAIDDRDGVDPEAEYAAWKLRELKRIKREREAIEAAEKEREEIERRRNLTAEEREREDREFIEKQKQEKEASRGQTGFMQRYFHKGAFFRDDLEREGLDKRNVMGQRFADDVARETLPEYMQIRDMTKLGKKGRTRYKDLRSEDTGRFGDGFDNRSRRREAAPLGIRDERFLPDRPEDGPKGPTGANASTVRERRRSRSRSYSPRRDRQRDRRDNRHDSRRDSYGGDDRYGDRDRRDRSRDRNRSRDRYRPDTSSRRKRSPSPYDDRDKRRRTDDAT
jgi:microfibrillar-associated protein 1